MPKVEKPKSYAAHQKKSDAEENEELKSTYVFDIQRILKEREAEGSLSYQLVDKKPESEPEPELEIPDINDLKKNSEKDDDDQSVIDLDEPSSFGLLKLAILDVPEYKKSLEIKLSSNKDESWLKILLLLSIEEDESVAQTHNNNLMKADWLPVLNDFQKCFNNWGVDLNILTNNTQLTIEDIDDNKHIKKHNFELVMNLLHRYVKEMCYTSKDLLIFAKFCVAMLFDHDCRKMKMMDMLKQLFNDCIDKALYPKQHTDIISFCNDLFSTYSQVELSKIITDLFLPLKNSTLKVVYTFLTYKLYYSLLEKPNDLYEVQYISRQDWFVQHLVDKNYFHNKSQQLRLAIKLLAHVVDVFDLYDFEDKLSTMHGFFTNALRFLPFEIPTMKLSDTVDKWRSQLFRIHINRCIEKLDHGAQHKNN